MNKGIFFVPATHALKATDSTSSLHLNNWDITSSLILLLLEIEREEGNEMEKMKKDIKRERVSKPYSQ